MVVEGALALALMASLLFSSRDIMVKKSLVEADLYPTVLVSLLFAVPFTALVAQLMGELPKLTSLEPIVMGYLAMAGVLQFALSRSLYYAAIGAIGASRSITIGKMDSALAVLFAVLLIGEEIDILAAGSVLIILLGVLLVSLSEPSPGASPSRLLKGMSPRFLKGLFYISLVAVTSGLVPLFIRLGVMDEGLPFLGIFLASSSALALIAPLSISSRHRRGLRRLSGRALKPILLAALFATTGQMAKFSALALAPVVFVAPILNANLLFTVLFSLLFLQRLEQVNLKVILGALLVIIGITALALG